MPIMQEPFARIIIDIVSPLSRTKLGNRYLLTILDQATMYPEAIPLKENSAVTVDEALIKFFSHFGFSNEIQSDQGSNFMSHVFQTFMYQLVWY